MAQGRHAEFLLSHKMFILRVDCGSKGNAMQHTVWVYSELNIYIYGYMSKLVNI